MKRGVHMGQLIYHDDHGIRCVECTASGRLPVLGVFFVAVSGELEVGYVSWREQAGLRPTRRRQGGTPQLQPEKCTLTSAS